MMKLLILLMMISIFKFKFLKYFEIMNNTNHTKDNDETVNFINDDNIFISNST